MASVVGARGQVTLEKELRDSLGVQPGWRVLQRRVEGGIELRFFPPPHRRSLRGALAAPGGPTLPTEEALREAREAAMEEELRERYAAHGGREGSE